MRNKGLLAFLLLLPLASCEKIEGSLPKNTGSLSSPTVSSEETVDNSDKQKENLFYSLLELADSNDFIVHYSFQYGNQSIDVSDIYTENYFLYGLEQEGQIILDSYDKSIGNYFAYNYAIEDGKVELKDMAVSYSEDVPSPLTKLEGSNYLGYLLLEESTFTEDSLVDEGDGYYSTADSVAILAFAQTLRIQIDPSASLPFDSARFNIDDNGGIDVELDNSSTGNHIIAKFNSIGKARNDLLDSYLKDQSISKLTPLNESNMSSLHGEVVSLDSTVTRYEGDNGSLRLKANIDEYYVPNSDTQKIKASYKAKLTDSSEYSRTFYYERIKDGTAIASYIDGQNEVHNSYTENDIVSSFKFGTDIPIIQTPTLFEAIAFRKIGDDRYQYVGYETRAILSALTFGSDLGEAETIFANIDNDGKLKSFDVITKLRTETGSSEPIYYSIHSEVVSPRSLSLLSNQTYSTYDEGLNKSFTDLKNLSKPFYISSYSSTNPKKKDELFYADNTLLFIKDGVYSGFRRTDHGVATFETSENDMHDGYIAKATNVEQGNKLDSRLPFNLSPNVFKKNGDAFLLQDNVRLINNKDQLFFMDNMKYLKLDSLILKSSNGEISSISYQEYDGQGNVLPAMVMDFKYENVKLPSNIDFSSVDKGETQNNSWEKNEPSVYEQMVSNLKDKAQNLPYLYDDGLSGTWEAGTDSPSYLDPLKTIGPDGLVLPLLNIYSFEDSVDKKYMDSYQSFLLSNGFTKGEYKTTSGKIISIYTSQEKGIRVLVVGNSDPSDGLYVTLI